MDLKESLLNIYPLLSEQGMRIMKDISRVRKVRGKSYVVEQGQPARTFVFIKSGIFRIGCDHYGEEDTIAFGQAGDPFTSLHTLVSDEPSVFCLQALTDAEVYEIDINDFRSAINTTPELLQWAYRLMCLQLYYVEYRYSCFSNLDAFDRYVQFVSKRSDLLHKIPLKYVAQYLGIQRETLSRCRRRYAHEKAGNTIL